MSVLRLARGFKVCSTLKQLSQVDRPPLLFLIGCVSFVSVRFLWPPFQVTQVGCEACPVRVADERMLAVFEMTAASVAF